MKLDSLSELEDDGLRAIIGRAEELLAQHDKERKAKALEEARATLAAVGLTLKDLTRSKGKPARGTVYKGGHSYRHPENKALVWQAKGKKPNWLVDLEKDGEQAIELTNGVAPSALKAMA